MVRLRRSDRGPTHRILVIDDNEELLESTRVLFERDGYEVLCASDPVEGIELVRHKHPHLILLDYFMPRMNGEAVVREIRKFDPLVQVLLVTGYAEEQPGRKLLRELDIQGYHDKADGAGRLLILVDAALKHYQVIDRLDRQRIALIHLVESGPLITRLQPVGELFQIALDSLIVMLGGHGDALVVTANNGLFIMQDAEEGLSIRAATGRFKDCPSFFALEDHMSSVVRSALTLDEPNETPDGIIVLPLRTRAGDRGCMLIETASLLADWKYLCEIHSRQVVQALENLLLYERSTHDQLTGLWNRSFGLERLDETLKLACRTETPTSVILLDIDHFKAVNDTWGHAAGDLAIVRVADALKHACRASDIVCRYGGEEFLIVLPATHTAGGKCVAEKVCYLVRELQIVFDRASIHLTISAGVATEEIQRWSSVRSADLISRADRHLYEAKASGRDRVGAPEEEAEG